MQIANFEPTTKNKALVGVGFAMVRNRLIIVSLPFLVCFTALQCD